MAIFHVTPENFEELIGQRDKKILVDFFADWCNPCKMLTPILEECAEEIQDDCIIAKLDTMACREIAMKFKVMSIPTLILFKDGKESDRVVGLRDKNEILDLFK